jgi:sulfur carrier protein
MLRAGASQTCARRSETMDVQVNGESKTLPESATVQGLLEHVDAPVSRVAVEVNGKGIRRGLFDQTPLKDGDRVETVPLVGGG